MWRDLDSAIFFLPYPAPAESSGQSYPANAGCAYLQTGTHIDSSASC